MLDPELDLGKYRARLSTVTASQRARAQHLEGHHQAGSSVLCLCAAEGVPMGVAKRGEFPPYYYLYNLRRPDVDRHAPTCPHRKKPSSPNPRLGKSLAPSPATRSPNRPAAIGNLLESVMIGAGLNAWSPKFSGKRNYVGMRYRLIEASKRVPIGGARHMSDLLFVPPPWTPQNGNEGHKEWEEFLALLAPDSKTLERGLVLGLLKSLEMREGWRAPRLHLAHWPDPFWLNRCPGSIAADSNERHRWLVLLAVESVDARTATVVDAAAQLMTTNWIPVASARHADLADDLVAKGLDFISPLPGDDASAWALPQFIVQEQGRRTLHPLAEG